MRPVPYVPEPLPPAGIDWESHIPQIASANRALARYDGILQAVPNPGILLSPLLTQEAVLSSRIEGTRASLEDVLRFEANPREPVSDAALADIQEIINYREALRAAADALSARRLDAALICDLHRILLADGRDVSGISRTLSGGTLTSSTRSLSRRRRRISRGRSLTGRLTCRERRRISSSSSRS